MKETTIKINVDSASGVKNVDALNKEIKDTTVQTKSLKAQLREMTAALNELEPGTVEFNSMAAAAGKLKDQIGDTNAVIKATAGGVGENLAGALTKTAGIGIAAFQGIASAQALFGVESEALTKTLVRLQALAGLSQALTELSKLDDTFTEIKASIAAATAAITKDTIAKGANTAAAATNAAATTAEGAAAGTAATAFGALTAAMLANPITSIIVGITALIGVMYALSDSEDNEVEAQKRQREERKKTIESVEKQLALYNEMVLAQKDSSRNIANEIEIMKAKGANDEEIYNKEIELIKTRKNELEASARTRAMTLAGDFVETSKWTKAEYKEYASLTQRKKVLVAEYNKSVSENNKKSSEERIKLEKEEAKIIEDIKNSVIDDNWDSYEQLNIATLKGKEKEFTIIKDAYDKEAQAFWDKNEKDIKAINETTKSKREKARLLNELELITNDTHNNMLLRQSETLQTFLINTQTESATLADNISKQLVENKIKDIEKERSERLKDNQLNIVDEKERLANEVSINLEFNTKRLEAVKELASARKSALQDEYLRNKDILDKEINDDAKHKEELIQSMKDYQEMVDTIKRGESDIKPGDTEDIEYQKKLAQTKIELALIEDVQSKKTKLSLDYQQQITEIDTELNDEIRKNSEDTTAITKNEYDKRLASAQEYTDKVSAIVNQATQAFQSVWQLQAEAESAAREESYARDTESLKAALAERSITQEKYDEETALMNQKLRNEELKAKRKSFQQNKALAISNAIMGGAQAVMQAMASAPPPYSFILAGIAAGISAVQVGVISSTQFKAAKGGIVPSNGQLSTQDSVPSLLAPGEIVVNSNSSKMFAPLLSAINEAGGGNKLVPDVSFANKQNAIQPVYQQQQTVKAFVVESELTDSQSRVARYKENNRF
jgi:hypothetical protein